MFGSSLHNTNVIDMATWKAQQSLRRVELVCPHCFGWQRFQSTDHAYAALEQHVAEFHRNDDSEAA